LRSYGSLLEDVEIFAKKSVSFKTTPYAALRGNFQNSVPKGLTASQIDVMCSNFVKFG